MSYTETIEVVTNLDGREVARTVTPHIDRMLSATAERKARGGV